MLIDTHCHLNFKIFEKNLSDIIRQARKVGVNNIVVPGTDIISSIKAVEIAKKYDGIYAGAGIHPHHIYKYQISKIKDQNHKLNIKKDLQEIEELLKNKKTVAVGEIGLDRYYYRNSKYSKYVVNPEFIKLQKIALVEQLKLAKKYKKAVILHNRQAKKDLLNILNTYFLLLNTVNVVFHCCEADEDLLGFAVKNKIFIGIDGDVTYRRKKQEFVKKIPLELLVLETDSPYLLPEPLRSKKFYPNEPKNLPIIVEYISTIKKIPTNQLIRITTENAKKLFAIN